MAVTTLDTILRQYQEEILGYALDYGLDPFRTVFELIDYDEMNEVAAYGGFPTRYPHWRFGMEFEELGKGYTYGLQKIYELVINNDPCYAYLMKSNSLTDQKLVMAHVYGHSDFFKHNLWFSRTNRRMIDTMANHGTRIRRYRERHGTEAVETFLDACLSLENLIDAHEMFAPERRRVVPEPPDEEEAAAEASEEVRRLPSKSYMERYINPPDFLAAQRKKAVEKADRRRRLTPDNPVRDVLRFLIENAPLEPWQRDVLSIVRDEAYYFAPQGMTKIMNEGWASYWHSTIMTEKALTAAEVVDYADHHSGTLAVSPGGMNPYKLGIELWRDIEDRWNRGRFGREWEACDDFKRKAEWDLRLGQGREKIFEVRRIYNDLTFVDAFLTKEFCARQKMFLWRKNAQTNRYEIADRDFAAIKAQFLRQLTNAGQPRIVVVESNLSNRGELLLRHLHDGPDLDLAEARDVLKNLHRIWGRPVHLQTLVGEEKKRLSFDGKEHAESAGD